MEKLMMSFAAALILGLSVPAAADVGTHKKIAARVLLEKMGQGDFSKIDEIYGPGFVVHSGGKKFDLAHDNASAMALRKAVPDMKIVVRQVVGDGDQVAVHWTASGTNSVAAAGLPGNGRVASVEGMTFFRFEKGRIVEEWSVTDMLSAMKELGML